VTDPYDLLAAQVAERIEAGKRPTKAQAEWLELLRPPSPSFSSVSKNRNAKGEVQPDVKVYHADPFEAARINDAIFDQQRARYPMADGTVGSPVIES
jgi:hypothetical protein